MTPTKFKNKLEEVLDEYFPKGKCKERGAALVLFAEAVILYKENYKEGMVVAQELKERKDEWGA